MFKRSSNKTWAGLLALGSLILGACGDLFDVRNPGEIDAAALDERSAIPALIVGMSADLSYGLTRVANMGSLMTHEQRNGDSRTARGYFDAGIIDPDESNTSWGRMHTARWVAETGAERLKKVLKNEFEQHPQAAMPYLYAGFANRILGENFCEAVIDGGPAEPHTVHFARAEAQFTEALRIAQAQGRQNLAYTALAGRAQVRAALGDLDRAAQDALQVPASFRFDAVYSTNSSRERNDLFDDTHGSVRPRLTIHETQWEAVPDDPRVPWNTLYDPGGAPMKTHDGKRLAYQQNKYRSPAAPVALAKGTEMLLIRAEAALRANQLPQTMALLNEQRAFYGLPALATPAEMSQAWSILLHERGAVLWLEARRFWDWRRWYAEGRSQFLANRDKCIPISRQELNSNPNLW